MKFFRLILSIILSCTLVFAPSVSAASNSNTQNFYFSDYDIDFYLTKAEDNTSKLHVKEELTAVFPNYDQNHGITREIPFTNQGGKNVVIESEEALNFSVKRNDEVEQYSISREDGTYLVRIGNPSKYVHGTQVYTLEYDFTDVITEFDQNKKNVSGKEGVEKAFQELYWDTNGNGWQQRIDNLTVDVHFADDVKKNLNDEVGCYVGPYGSSDSSRCNGYYIKDGYRFTTTNLEPGENLTFVVNLKPDTFEVIVKVDYVPYIVIGVEILIMVIFLLWSIRRWIIDGKRNHKLYRDTFVAPEYQPPKDITVSEGAELVVKSPKTPYVATLLELAVNKKISFQKLTEQEIQALPKPRRHLLSFKSKEDAAWKIIINVDPETFTVPQREVVKILANGPDLKQGMTIPIVRNEPSPSLASYANKYQRNVIKTLKEKKYLKKKLPTNSMVSLFVTIGLFAVFSAIGVHIWNNNIGTSNYGGGVPIVPISFVLSIVFYALSFRISSKADTYGRYTEEGVKKVRQLEGLELYIKMAEAERIKFLQSVEGADTSPEGIVKLYEKLLPWACVFGQEKSWAKEINQYYESCDFDPSFSEEMMQGIIFYNMLDSINSDISRPSSYSSSGSGGGGFSGGGGGGGGGGGW